MRDDNFHRTIVLVLEHGPQGAVGVVLNRPSETKLGEIASELGPLAAPPGLVHVGGPVAPAAAVCLGRRRPGTGRVAKSESEPDSTGVSALFGDVLSVDLDRGVDAFRPHVGELRLFAGYAGWEAGQLDGEVEVGGWFVVDRRDDDVFSREPRDLWRQVLRRQRRRDLAILAAFPEEPSLN